MGETDLKHSLLLVMVLMGLPISISAYAQSSNPYNNPYNCQISTPRWYRYIKCYFGKSEFGESIEVLPEMVRKASPQSVNFIYEVDGRKNEGQVRCSGRRDSLFSFTANRNIPATSNATHQMLGYVCERAGF